MEKENGGGRRMRKVLVIGAGGIGSFLLPLLDKVGLYSITVADPDNVERKNLPYQNFTEEDIGENKAKVMFGKHENIVNSSPYPILTEKQMQGYDLVISCVDNLSLRKTLYNSNVKWLDLRAQGRNAALVSCLANPETYDTLLAGDGDRSYSCQGDGWDGSNEGVHFMQVVIAGMGAEWIQRWFNNEEVGDFKMVNI